ncbi:N-acetyltransferase GCN5 [Caballeronia calidae]|uniref:N-acetyltransferase GCN5 n=1 Tax=Caballeronia calidae TaxID=1777139 RepID=A0A158EF83_9BURK|nr:GNAT family N-acetyltransferase [Caballeronia calidae]SAL05474.1 N-acetyltransferase GCN5 [Caballeronia calidae]
MSQCTEILLVRAACLSDIEEIARIYAYYVTNTTVTFETVPPSIEEMKRRFDDVVAAGAPYLVAVEDDRILGYAYAAPFKPRAAYARTVEHSVYLASDAAGRGIGRRLLEELVVASRDRGFTEMIATVAGDGNHASLRLHARCGFVPAGILRNVGFKHDRWLDVTLLQRSLRGAE